VAGHADIIKPEEVPDTWGFARPEGDKLKIIRKAPKLKGDPLDRPFVASVLRNIRDKSGLPDTVLRKKYQEGFEEGRKQALGMRQIETERWKREHEQLRALVAEFERTSGIRINRWTMGDVGELVQLLRSFRPTKILRRAKQLWDRELATAQQQVTSLEQALGEAEALEQRVVEARKKRKKPGPQ
jgi:hypothetical protein